MGTTWLPPMVSRCQGLEAARHVHFLRPSKAEGDGGTSCLACEDKLVLIASMEAKTVTAGWQPGVDAKWWN